MADEAARFAAWLAESRGGLAAPSKAYADALEALRADGDIDLATIVTPSSAIPREDSRELWTAIFTEACAKVESATSAKTSAPKLQRILAWALEAPPA